MARMSGQDTDNNNIVEDKDSGNYDGGLATDKVDKDNGKDDGGQGQVQDTDNVDNDNGKDNSVSETEVTGVERPKRNLSKLKRLRCGLQNAVKALL